MKLPRFVSARWVVDWKGITGLPTVAGIRNGSKASFSSFVLFSIVAYLTSIAIDSPLRYGLNMFHAAALIYLRDVLLFLLLFLTLHRAIQLRRMHKGILVLLAILGFHSAVNVLVMKNIPMTLFGIKVFLPLVAGSLAAAQLSIEQKRIFTRSITLIWFVTLCGILIEGTGIEFPWKGFSVDIGGTTVEGNRDWSAVGIARLAGFTRASYDAAIILSVSPMLFLYDIKRRWRILVIVGSIAGIALTVTKGAFLAFFLTSILIALLEFKQTPKGLIVTTFILLSFGSFIGLPLYFEGSHFVFDRTDLVQEFLLGSFRERITGTWPDAWTYIADPMTNILGVGIGGIGSAQHFFSNSSYQPGDNLFVYSRVVFGVASYVYFAHMAVCGLQKYNGSRKHSTALFIVLCALSGITLAVAESGAFSLLLGYFILPFRRTQSHFEKQKMRSQITNIQ